MAVLERLEAMVLAELMAADVELRPIAQTIGHEAAQKMHIPMLQGGRGLPREMNPTLLKMMGNDRRPLIFKIIKPVGVVVHDAAPEEMEGLGQDELRLVVVEALLCNLPSAGEWKEMFTTRQPSARRRQRLLRVHISASRQVQQLIHP